MQLHKRDVVAAAAKILDEYGIADLTMRRLARELDITPGALYWHFANKQQLLGAVADLLLAPVSEHLDESPDTDWSARITVTCTRLHDTLLSHTDGAELVSASFAAAESAAAIAILDALARAAEAAGLDPGQAMPAARALVYYVLGAAADEQSRRRFSAAPAADSAGFAFGLRLLVDGVSAQSAADRVLDPLITVPPA